MKFAKGPLNVPVEVTLDGHPDIKMKLLDKVLDGSWRHVDGRWLAVRVYLYHNGVPTREGAVSDAEGFRYAVQDAGVAIEKALSQPDADTD